jgi:hypothetical protein
VIEIDSFVPRQQIDQRFFDTPYYVAPNEPVAQEAFAVIRDAGDPQLSGALISGRQNAGCRSWFRVTRRRPLGATGRTAGPGEKKRLMQGLVSGPRGC